MISFRSWHAPRAHHHHHRHTAAAIPKRRRWWRTFAVVFVALVAVRAVLPIGVRAWVNRVLARTEQYRGSIGDVDLDLWRGAYHIDSPKLFKLVSGRPEPFLEMQRLDCSLQWRALLRGQVVADVTLHRPNVEFVLAQSAEQSQTGKEESWAARLDELVPFRINRFVVRDGEVRLQNTTVDPPVDAYATDVYLEALNISNIRGSGPTDDATSAELPAEVELAGRPFGTAELEIRVRFDPLADPMRFELDASVADLMLIDLNDYLRAYGRVDAESGTVGIYAEFAGSDGRIEGYVKTLFDEMVLLRFDEIDDPTDAIEALWEGLVALAGEVLENQPHDRLATKIPLRGTMTGTSADLIATVGNLLRNAFVAALGPAIDDTVELRDMEAVEDGEGS